ncbi:manganese efflux pump [Amycolatopsis rhabdoformis]|uniref:Manganese efflux pump n=1 Tax=Amycolatopsis rhabdoformis TaxID=1448059 RepID=A0ABZ1IJC4_9PSEU|nr:manganese efflux pump [Amycolatopsis rhabdoformis]WSE34545.1 manganese efflux pump [Amycolatopsis rhabdoformis]
MNLEFLPLIALAFGLSLDNFRSSIAIGTIPFGWKRALQVSLVFGLWDAVGPLLGGFLGRFLGDFLGEAADWVGAVVLGLYGVYFIVSAIRNPEPEDMDHPWMTLFGMPLSLSIDNFIAGAGLGLAGFSLIIPMFVFGAMTVVMSFVGLYVGRMAAKIIRVRSDLVSGISLLGAAILLPLVFG